MCEESLAQVLIRARSGELQAWDVLLRHYGPHIERVVQRQLRTRNITGIEAKDVSQSVVRRILLRRGECCFEDTRQLLGYLLRCSQDILRRHVAKELSRDTRTQTTRILDQLPDSSGDDPSIRLETLESIHSVKNILTHQEWLIVQRRAEGSSWSDIAEELELSADAVRMRFMRLRHRVSSFLSD